MAENLGKFIAEMVGCAKIQGRCDQFNIVAEKE
jgi:hypothetical protein